MHEPGADSSLREDAPFQAQIEGVKTVILPNDGPVPIELVLDVVSLPARLGDIFARTNHQPLRPAAQPKFREQLLPQINGKALRLLLRSKSHFVARQLSCAE